MLKGDVFIYSGGGGSKEGGESKGLECIGFYKYLMSGVLVMFLFVVGGGILIVILFMFGIYLVELKDLMYNVFVVVLKIIGGDNVFFLLVLVLVGFIVMSIVDCFGLVFGMVVGFLVVSGGGGFLGGLIVGFLVGYVVVGLKKLFSGLL